MARDRGELWIWWHHVYSFQKQKAQLLFYSIAKSPFLFSQKKVSSIVVIRSTRVSKKCRLWPQDLFQKKSFCFKKIFEEVGGRERVYTNKQDRKKMLLLWTFHTQKIQQIAALWNKTLLLCFFSDFSK